MRKVKIALGEYYHIYNRGNNKQETFLDTRDWIRFLFLIIYDQSSQIFYNLGRQVSHFVRHSVFNIDNNCLEKINKSRSVELVSFALMPNHYHLLVRESSENGISTYMQRVQNAYTKYFNTKYKKSGHLFQGPFQVVHVKTNNQLLYLSAYIHRNPRDIAGWKTKEDKYPWSSYQDCAGFNRWNKLLEHQVLTKQFKNSNEYRIFIETNPAKKLAQELLLD